MEKSNPVYHWKIKTLWKIPTKTRLLWLPVEKSKTAYHWRDKTLLGIPTETKYCGYQWREPIKFIRRETNHWADPPSGEEQVATSGEEQSSLSLQRQAVVDDYHRCNGPYGMYESVTCVRPTTIWPLFKFHTITSRRQNLCWHSGCLMLLGIC